MGDSDEHEHLNGPTTQLETVSARTPSTQAFAVEKAQQRQLSGTARFENVRRQRAADRLRLHNACQQARKTKERALRDAEIASKCLVDDVPTRGGSYIQIDSSELPTDFIDLTRRPVPVDKEKRLSNQPWPPRSWKGEGMELALGAAYVLITDRDQGVL
jgi:hypothetical protein